MKVMRKRLMVLILSAILLANTLVVSSGFAVATSEKVTTLSEKSSTLATTASPKLPKSYEYVLDTDGYDVGATYVIVHRYNGNNRVLFCSGTMTDVLSTTVTDDKLTLNSSFESGTQLWEVVSTDNNGGIALKSKYSKATYYLDLSKRTGSNVYTSNIPVKVSINKGVLPNTHTIQGAKDGVENYWLGYNTSKNRFSATTDNMRIEVYFYKQTEVPVKIVDYDPPKGTTQNQPFAHGTGGSENFRIPAIITLSDGTLVAAADARWNHSQDGGAIDIIVSTSKDNGKNWKYSMPMYFNDSINMKSSDGSHSILNYATTFIDAGLVRDHNDKIYLIADLFPGSVANASLPQRPATASGYREIDGKSRLVLYTSNKSSEQTDDNYAYYVGDYGTDGYAPVYAKGQNNATASYYLDKGFYLYDSNKEPMYCLQIGNPRGAVKQNVFFYNADLHVRCAMYLYLITSEDGGETWSDPTILNPQIRENEMFYGVGPGAGICLEDGTIMFPCYSYKGTIDSMRSSFIYSKDGGVTWKRSEDVTDKIWSGESALVEIDDTTVRQFIRCQYKKLTYVDHILKDGKWVTTNIVNTLEDPVKNDNQLSAMRLSKTSDGKPVIMVSTASDSDKRSDGRIYTYVLEPNNSMTKVAEYDVYPVGGPFAHETSYPDGKEYYAYSSIAELKDGDIALLAETAWPPSRITYKDIPLTEVAPNVSFDKPGEYVRETHGIEVGAVYVITYESDGVNRLLYCNDTVTDAIPTTVVGNKLTLHDWLDPKKQLWQVVSVDNGKIGLMSMVDSRYYLDLSIPYPALKARTSRAFQEVVIEKGTTPGTYTIRGKSSNIWLSYDKQWNQFSTTFDKGVDLALFKRVES